MMDTKTFSFSLLTDTGCHGAFPKTEAEMRIPSIRGQLRRWHTILWGEEDMKKCWGAVVNSTAHASKVVLRLRPASGSTAASTKTSHILPHSNDPRKKQSTMPILSAGASYCIEVRYRLLGPDAETVRDHVEKTIRCWLLLGTIGQRGTRAFGSVWPREEAPASLDQYRQELDRLLSGKYAYRISSKQITGMGDALMKFCTDTLSGQENEKYFGSINPRRTSPLKMKYIKIGGMYYLVLHAKRRETIDGALKALTEANKPKPLLQYF